MREKLTSSFFLSISLFLTLFNVSDSLDVKKKIPREKWKKSNMQPELIIKSNLRLEATTNLNLSI